MHVLVADNADHQHCEMRHGYDVQRCLPDVRTERCRISGHRNHHGKQPVKQDCEKILLSVTT